MCGLCFRAQMPFPLPPTCSCESAFKILNSRRLRVKAWEVKLVWTCIELELSWPQHLHTSGTWILPHVAATYLKTSLLITSCHYCWLLLHSKELIVQGQTSHTFPPEVEKDLASDGLIHYPACYACCLLGAIQWPNGPMAEWHPSAASTSRVNKNLGPVKPVNQLSMFPTTATSNLSVLYVFSHWPVGRRTLTLVQLAPKSHPIPQLWSQLHETMKPSDQAKKYVHPRTSEIRLPTPGFSAGIKRPGHKTCSLARAPKMCIHRESVQSIVSTA